MGWEIEPSRGEKYSETRYNPRAFYVHSTDDNGNYRSIRLGPLTVPPFVAGRINRLVQSERYPSYDTSQAVIRDLIIHGLHHRGEMEGDEDILDTIGFHTIQHKIAAKRETRAQMRRAFAEVRGEVTDMRDMKRDRDVIEGVVKDFIRTARAATPSDLLVELEKELAELRKDVKKILDET